MAVAAVFLAQSAWAFDHSAWDQVLKLHIRAGLVEYATLKSEPAALDAYLASLAALKEAGQPG